MPIQYKLSKIENPQFAIIKEDEIENLNVDFEVNFSISSPVNSIRCSLKAVYKNGDDAVMQIVVNCYFTLSPESWQSLTNENKNIVIYELCAYYGRHKSFPAARRTVEKQILLFFTKLFDVIFTERNYNL